MKVWVLTRGRYSDETVEGVFSSPKTAKEYTVRFPNSDWNDPMEFEIDAYEVKRKAGFEKYVVKMDHKMNLISCELEESPYHFTQESFHSCMRSVGCFWLLVWARDEEHAIKICSEKVFEFLATNQEAAQEYIEKDRKRKLDEEE